MSAPLLGRIPLDPLLARATDKGLSLLGTHTHTHNHTHTYLCKDLKRNPKKVRTKKLKNDLNFHPFSRTFFLLSDDEGEGERAEESAAVAAYREIAKKIGEFGQVY